MFDPNSDLFSDTIYTFFYRQNTILVANMETGLNPKIVL